MTTDSIFDMYDIFKKNFGDEKAKEIVIAIESIIDRNMEKADEIPKEQIKSNIYDEVIKYFEAFPYHNEAEHSGI
jgi:hypothetical protein